MTLYVLVLLLMGNNVLLVRRINQTFAPGHYSLVGGKVEKNETATRAIQREVQEETGLAIPMSAFKLVHTLHRKGTEDEFVALFFEVDITNFPAPQNKEPHKHDDIKFFPLNALPENIIPAHKQAIEYMMQDIAYSEHGW